jgi:hypothetical protein
MRRIDNYRLDLVTYVPLPFGSRLLLSYFPPIKNKEYFGKNFYPPFLMEELISQKKLYKLLVWDWHVRDFYIMYCEQFLNNEDFELLNNDLRELLINHFTAVYYLLNPAYPIIKQILNKLNG